MAEIFSLIEGDEAERGTELPSDRVLDAASDADLVTVTVVGWMPDGSFYVASTHSHRDGIADLEMAKAKLVEAEFANMGLIEE
jgi:hypothetical protein